MKRVLKNNRAFTLIEMMIVLLVISVILLVAIPNITKHSETINEKGCDAYKQMLEAQIQAYYIENQQYPSSGEDLKSKGYVKDNILKCPNGIELTISDGQIEEN